MIFYSQKQVSQIDFQPKPLHDLNVPSNQKTVKYRSTTQRLKSVQAKIDTGIARKPLTALDKENVRYKDFSFYDLGGLVHYLGGLLHYLGGLVHYLGGLVYYLGGIVHYLGDLVHYLGGLVHYLGGLGW